MLGWQERSGGEKQKMEEVGGGDWRLSGSGSGWVWVVRTWKTEGSLLAESESESCPQPGDSSAGKLP